MINFLDTAQFAKFLNLHITGQKKINTAHLHANLKVNMKTGQPCRLNAIVPAGAKRHEKTLAFKLTFIKQYF